MSLVMILVGKKINVNSYMKSEALFPTEGTGNDRKIISSVQQLYNIMLTVAN